MIRTMICKMQITVKSKEKYMTNNSPQAAKKLQMAIIKKLAWCLH